jgi:hypothetical protein
MRLSLNPAVKDLGLGLAAERRMRYHDHMSCWCPGTDSGYQRHMQTRTPPCPESRTAHSASTLAWKRDNREQYLRKDREARRKRERAKRGARDTSGDSGPTDD